MKRMSLLLMTVSVIAVLESSNVGPGRSQSVNDCMGVEINGASGLSVCEDTWFGTWTWAAPITGPVTFDTDDSDFDLLLAVSDFDGTFQGEIHFRAKQGQEYRLFAWRTNNSVDPGTVVLNWWTSSTDGSRSVSNDNFDSSVAIAGASGRSTGNNVGADKEGDEPDHADDSGGASVWWTWTAPATGLATFDTRGSDFDTLLAVYTGDNLNDLTEIASNDDAQAGDVVFEQSEAHFTTQQGQTYHLAVDGYVGATGTVVLNWWSSSSGGGDTQPIETDPSLRERVVENPDPGKPSYILTGQNASLQYWKNADGAVSQALYRSAAETVSVWTFYDETTGLPRKVSDELSGNWLLIQENGADSVDVWFYDRDGSYQHGFAVFDDADRYKFAEIAGLPIHGGKEITGDLVSTTSSWTGSFTLDVDTGDLKTPKLVAADIAELMEDLAPDDTLLSGLSVGGMILLGLGLVDDFSGDGIATMGAAALVASLFVPDVAAGNREKCMRLGNSVSRGVCKLAADFLAHDVEIEPTGLVRDAADWARDEPGHLANRIDRGKEALENVAGRLLPDDAIHGWQDTEPLSSETPPPIGSRVSGEASGPGDTVAQVEGDITPDGDFAVTGYDDRDLSVVIKGSVGDDDTAGSGALTPTLTGTGASPLRVATGNSVVAEDTSGDAAAFEWGGYSGMVRSIRSAVVLHGNAPVVVRKIRLIRGPSDGTAVTLDLSEYFSDPNGDTMRFTALSSQEHLNLRVSGSMLSIHTTFDGNVAGRIRVKAADPGGLEAEISFPIKINYSAKGTLWTLNFDYQSNPPHMCTEYVILDRDAYERHRQRLLNDAWAERRRHGAVITGGWYGIALPPIDTRSGKPKCPGPEECVGIMKYWSDGLSCPDGFVSGGGCHSTFDWGTYSNYRRYHDEHGAVPTWGQEAQSQYREGCQSSGWRWSTQRPQSTDNFNLVDRILNWVIKYFDVPGYRDPCLGRPKIECPSRTVAIGVRG